MSEWHLSQVNVARMRYPADDPQMAGFTSRLDEINALAESSPGFVWRFKDDSGNATDTRLFNDPDILFNMSVWGSVQALKDFTYRSEHRALLSNRKHWFFPNQGPTMVLWWVPAGHQPSTEEGLEKLELLRSQGPGDKAFMFSKIFAPQ